MMSNIRGGAGPANAYGQSKRSRIVQGHAYGESDHKQDALLRNVSSNLSTENYHSNQVLPAVSEYADANQKATMFDPLPSDGKRQELAQSSSKDLHATAAE